MGLDESNAEPLSDIATPLRAAHRVLEDLNNELRGELALTLKSDQQKLDNCIRTEIFSQVERRILIRSVFSYIEAVTYSLKALVLSDPHSSELTEGEKIFASELTYDLKADGDVVIRSTRIQLTSNIRFTFKIFSKIFGNWTSLDIAGQGWEYLQRSIKVRDRITHPKASPDLFISDVEVVEAHHALNWFDSSVRTAMIEWAAAATMQAEELEKSLRQILRENDKLPP